MLRRENLPGAVEGMWRRLLFRVGAAGLMRLWLRRRVFSSAGARMLFLLVCVLVVLAGTWLAVFRGKVRRAGEWFAKRPDFVIAVMGKDDLEGAGRSDTIILVNLRYPERKVRVLSIPRDTRVLIERPMPGGGRKPVVSKLNHALRWGGVPLAVETVEHLTGIHVDVYVVIGYGLFIDVVDCIGGVPLEVEKRMYYRDRAGGLTIDLYPGYQILDGAKALQYVRFRHDGMGDVGRIARQQKFMKAFLARLKEPASVLRLVRNLPVLMKRVSTNLPLDKALSLAARFGTITRSEVEFRTLLGRERMFPVGRDGRRRASFIVLSPPTIERIKGWFLSPHAESSPAAGSPLELPASAGSGRRNECDAASGG